jgi:hypothetical protein
VNGDLVVDNGNIGTVNLTTIPGNTYASATVKGGAKIAINGIVTAGDLIVNGSEMRAGKLVVPGTITLQNQSMLTHAAASTSSIYKLEIETTTLTVDATSKIDVSARGYLGGYQGGNNSTSGRTNGNVIGSTHANGGSFGGLGGTSAWSGTVNGAYGDLLNPNEVGSGGGGDSSNAGGNGGGLVRISAGTVTLQGSILADGGVGYYGSGSGGGIRIEADTLAGSGKIYARGGTSTDIYRNGGAGGGGRIAIYYGTMSLPVGNVLAHGGKSYDGGTATRNGGAGTIYLKADTQVNGDLLISNNGTAVSSATTPVRAVGRGLIYSVTPSSLSVNTSRWAAGALVGLRIKPNVNRDDLFTVVNNTATTIFTDPEEGDLSWWAPVGSTFSGVYRFDWVTISGKASVNSADIFEITETLLVDDATLVSGGVVAGKVTTANDGIVRP